MALSFVKNRLLSFVDNKYNTKPYKEKRALCGFGLGGGAVMEALCSTNREFSGLFCYFLACAPARGQSALAELRPQPISANVYLFSGSEQDRTELEELRNFHGHLERGVPAANVAHEVRVDPTTGEQRIIESEKRAAQKITLEMAEGADHLGVAFATQSMEWLATLLELAQHDSLARMVRGCKSEHLPLSLIAVPT